MTAVRYPQPDAASDDLDQVVRDLEEGWVKQSARSRALRERRARRYRDRKSRICSKNSASS